jgi:hypothetical protein
VTVVALAGVLLVLPAAPCWACRCVVQTPRQHAANADVVFTGKVVEAEDPFRHSGPRVQAGLRVEAVYKGSVEDVAVVETPRGGTAACGFRFVEGTRYTVFAYRNERGRLETNTCSATAEGGIDPARFGLGPADSETAAGSEPADEPAVSWSTAVIAGSILLGGGIGLLVWRTRRGQASSRAPTGGGAPPRPS